MDLSLRSAPWQNGDTCREDRAVRKEDALVPLRVRARSGMCSPPGKLKNRVQRSLSLEDRSGCDFLSVLCPERAHSDNSQTLALLIPRPSWATFVLAPKSDKALSPLTILLRWLCPTLPLGNPETLTSNLWFGFLCTRGQP